MTVQMRLLRRSIMQSAGACCDAGRRRAQSSIEAAEAAEQWSPQVVFPGSPPPPWRDIPGPIRVSTICTLSGFAQRAYHCTLVMQHDRTPTTSRLALAGFLRNLADAVRVQQTRLRPGVADNGTAEVCPMAEWKRRRMTEHNQEQIETGVVENRLACSSEAGSRRLNGWIMFEFWIRDHDADRVLGLLLVSLASRLHHSKASPAPLKIG